MYSIRKRGQDTLDAWSRFGLLPQSDKCVVEYVWIDSDHQSFRAKSRTLQTVPENVEDIPPLTYKSPGNDEIRLKPAALFKDPVRAGNNKIVLCDTYDLEENATASNKRVSCLATMNEFESDEPWFGFDQEFMLLTLDGQRAIGWPYNGLPKIGGPYYCGVGTNNVCGRDVVEAHYAACQYAGVNYWSLNAEPLPGMWEFQIGVCKGVQMGDHLWMARYLMHRVADEFGCKPSFDPYPLTYAKGLIPKPRCCTNFSTEGMRSQGLRIIEAAITRLSQTHNEFVEFEQASGSAVVTKFSETDKPSPRAKKMPPPSRSNPRSVASAVVRQQPVPKLAEETDEHSGVARMLSNRDTLFRIPAHVVLNGKGYMQDRRPESNCDPYVVTEAIVRTVCHVRRRISGPLMFNRGFRSLDGTNRGSEAKALEKPSPYQSREAHVPPKRLPLRDTKMSSIPIA